MVHTLPDYTSKWKMLKLSANVDNAELAARINGINTFDRRGNVLYIEDFVCPNIVHPISYLGGAGAATISCAYRKTGEYSLKVVTDDAAN